MSIPPKLLGGEMGSKLLAIYDPSGKLGLTKRSIGGGEVPILGRIDGAWYPEGCMGWSDCRYHCMCAPDAKALLLRTKDGTVDPIGMARAREVLAAQVMKLRSVSGGVTFVAGLGPNSDDFKCEYIWTLAVDLGYAREKRTWGQLPDESAVEALARLLAEHAGVEVIRG